MTALLIVGIIYFIIGLFLAVFYFMLSASVQKESGSLFFVTLFLWPLVLTGVIK